MIPAAIKSRIIQKGRCAVSDVDRWLTNKGEGKPMAIDLETNSDCTRDCEYCPRDTRLDDVLAEKTVHRLIDQLADWNFNGRVSFHSYNEPLTDERLLDFYRYLSKKLPQAQSEVFTNGDLLTQEMVEDLLAVGVERIYITIHEPTSVVQAERLQDFGNAFKQVKVLDFRNNQRSQPLENRGGLVELESINPTRYCGRVDAMTVRANGNVVLCCNDAQQKHVMGSIHQTSLQEIWWESGFTALRQDIRKGRMTLGICKACGSEAVLNSTKQGAQ
ncbi:MAG: radical SAM protein [bacterium]|nr:radical SAM protein [bacterium]